MTEVRKLSGRKRRKSAENLPLLSAKLGIAEDLKSIAADDLKRCKYSREEVALAISGQVGRQITVAQIDSWVAETKPHHFPFDVIPAWTRITGSFRLLEFVCADAGYHLATNKDHYLSELGKRVIEREKAVEREARLKMALAEQL